MLYVVIVLLASLAAYLLCRLFLVKKAMNQATEELKEISKELEENRVLRQGVPDKELEKLLGEINTALEMIRKTKRRYEQREKEFQKEYNQPISRNNSSSRHNQ